MSTPENPILVPALDELSVEFERLRAIARAAAARFNATPDDDNEAEKLAMYAADEAVEACSHQIAQLPPQTPEHVRLVARVLDWWLHEVAGGAYTPEEHLLQWLVRSVLEGVPVQPRAAE